MKAETLLASIAMALFGVIFAVMVANAFAPPEHSATLPKRTAAPPPPPPPQSVAPAPTHTDAEATSIANVPADARSRDERRRTDLAGLQAGLKDYKEKKGSYPSTGGSIQTACVYEKLDKLCAIKGYKGVGSFIDPRGQVFGYYYASDGKTYALYASMEGDNSASDPCPGDISVFKTFINLFCKTSESSN
jgi:hypothetical protein